MSRPAASRARASTISKAGSRSVRPTRSLALPTGIARLFSSSACSNARRGEMTSCSYSVRVRIRVRAGETDNLARRNRLRHWLRPATRLMPMIAPSRQPRPMPPSGRWRRLATALGFVCMTRSRRASASKLAVSGVLVSRRKSLCWRASRRKASARRFARSSRARQTNRARCLAAIAMRRQIARLRTLAPELKTQRGEHYADVLERLFQARLPASGPDRSRA